ncbi:molybdopterin-synthase adenylyltransferase MoeB [Lampropedia puyangensis]|uniref:Molybdopterin-synthase adenylyltransferase n=1 Tax=Lampropedia puyangensis TaxID=1330072 RepID=A0A4S8EXQ5_9BURK|nr:molybdopterin-synthase adenylyltransferase MoeB [Lampropedia puyangensis]THT99356.1 molybdopterin-synthase adenylyltransferase MoeB [Lampropedia puyangensis]
MIPLVAPALTLSPQEQARYARHLELQGFGMQAQLCLKNARILVVGAGGLGSAIVPYLAAAGVGTLGIVDDDVVDLSNLQRQIMHREADIGLAKTASARRHVLALNPHVEVIEHAIRLTATNALEILSHYDVVLDGADNFATRYLVSDAAALLGMPCVWGSILQFEGQVSVFWRGHGPTYRDVFPEPPEPGEVPSCAQAGVLGVLPGQIGVLMAAEAIKLVTGVGEPLLGRMLVFDALRTQWRDMRVQADPSVPAVTALLPDYPAFCGVATDREAAMPRLSVHALHTAMAEHVSGQVWLVDVRESSEWNLGAIDGARHAPLATLLQAVSLATLPSALLGIEDASQVVLYCQSGQRAAAAAAHLAELGLERVSVLDGNVATWRVLMAQ